MNYTTRSKKTVLCWIVHCSITITKLLMYLFGCVGWFVYGGVEAGCETEEHFQDTIDVKPFQELTNGSIFCDVKKRIVQECGLILRWCFFLYCGYKHLSKSCEPYRNQIENYVSLGATSLFQNENIWNSSRFWQIMVTGGLQA